MPQGLYFEDFTKGKKLYTSRRTVTETDLVTFTTLCGTETDLVTFTTLCGFFEPLFMDQAYVESETPFKKRIAPGALTFSISEGLAILSGILYKTGMAFLGVEMEVQKPVFIGDTLTVEIEVIDRRETKKTDRQVMEYKIKRMIKRKTG